MTMEGLEQETETIDGFKIPNELTIVMVVGLNEIIDCEISFCKKEFQTIQFLLSKGVVPATSA